MNWKHTFLHAESHLIIFLCSSPSMLAWLSDCFWQERLWFPEGLGWKDLQDRDGRVYAKAEDLWVVIPLALGFLIVRQIFERSVPPSLASPSPLTMILQLYYLPTVLTPLSIPWFLQLLLCQFSPF